MGGLFEVLAHGFEAKATDISNYTWAELLGSSNAKSGVSVNVDSALKVSTVMACGRVLAEGVAQIPKKVYEVDGDNKKPALDHPAYNILCRRPNDWMTSFELFETMMLHAVMTNGAYAYIGWGGNEIQELIPLVPSNVTVIRAPDYSLTYRISDLNGVVTTLQAENVLHIHGPSWNGYTGLDMIQTAREAIGLAIATEETHASLHANGAQPGGVLSVKGKLDEPARQRLKAAWQAFQGGVANRFKTAVLDIEADWKPLAMSGVDSQHIETRRFQIEEICRAFRVFPQMVMHSDKTSTFASAESFFLAHVTHSLMPWIVRWEQAIEHKIFGNDPKYIFKFNLNALLRGDTTSRFTAYEKALGGARGETAWMTRNEVRSLEEMDPIEGGDKLLVPVIAAPAAQPGVSDTGKTPVVA